MNYYTIIINVRLNYSDACDIIGILYTRIAAANNYSDVAESIIAKRPSNVYICIHICMVYM